MLLGLLLRLGLLLWLGLLLRLRLLLWLRLGLLVLLVLWRSLWLRLGALFALGGHRAKIAVAVGFGVGDGVVDGGLNHSKRTVEVDLAPCHHVL